MSWQDFYTNPDLADGFGSTAGGRANPHRGLDFSRLRDTLIPSYVAGTVVINEWSAVLGWILEVKTPLGRFVGFRHMLHQSPFAVGAEVKVGQGVGFVGNTGSASMGFHLCTTNASGKGGVHGSPSLLTDPWPYITAALGSSTAGESITPLTPTAQLNIGDELKAYEDAGPKAQNKGIGAVYVGGPGVWRQVPPNKYVNDREILRQAFGDIIPLLTPDLALVKEMCVGK